ncbi:MAG: hypothetical protein JSW06_11305 [Thermoplasmatales archaeon]|nr:MAG: hypothetical protein JSW06_11305 [Thermoplasmatales archaeon]
MGKGESAEGAEAGSDISTTETTVEDKKQSVTEPTAETAEQHGPEKASDTETATAQATGDKKEDVENLRTVIKVNEKEDQTEENIKEAPTEEEKTDKIITPKISDPAPAPSSDSKAELEQRRDILQSIKDFDFQIKKNQEDIGKIGEKIGGLTKDIDDLVSLYEIVSEQMNPFVGLSKVTKKRIDALENFTQEIEEIKTRMGDVESELEKGIGGIRVIKKKLEKKDTDPEPNNVDNKPESELEKPAVPTEEVISTSSPLDTIQFAAGDLSDDDLEKILSKSLEDLLVKQNIDNMINEFLLSLK